jgi:hypothetical protein
MMCTGLGAGCVLSSVSVMLRECCIVRGKNRLASLQQRWCCHHCVRNQCDPLPDMVHFSSLPARAAAHDHYTSLPLHQAQALSWFVDG